MHGHNLHRLWAHSNASPTRAIRRFFLTPSKRVQPPSTRFLAAIQPPFRVLFRLCIDDNSCSRTSSRVQQRARGSNSVVYFNLAFRPSTYIKALSFSQWLIPPLLLPLPMLFPSPNRLSSTSARYPSTKPKPLTSSTLLTCHLSTLASIVKYVFYSRSRSLQELFRRLSSLLLP